MRTLVEIILVTNDGELSLNLKDSFLSTDLELAATIASDSLQNIEQQQRPRLFLVDGDIGEAETKQLCMDLRLKNTTAEIGILVLMRNASDEYVTSLLTSAADDVVSRQLRPGGLLGRMISHLRRIEAAEKLALKVRDSQILIELTSRLLSSNDLLGNLFDMSKMLSTELDVDRCSVVLLRQDHSVGIVIASSDDSDIRNLIIDLDKYPEIKQVAINGLPLVVPNVEDSKILEDVLPNLLTVKISSVALFPIVDKTRVHGVIFFRFSHHREDFEQRELVFCQTVANATAIALRNDEILASLKAKTEEVEQVQSEARIKLASLRQYEDFFTNSSDGMVVLSDTGVVVFVNTEGANMLDRKISSIRGLPFAKLLGARDPERLEQLLNAAERRENKTMDFYFQFPDGSEKVLSISAGALGVEGMILITMRDVTDDRITERCLMDTQKRLIESEKQTVMMELAGAAAHELNQPLTSISAAISMMRRLISDDDEKPQRIVSIIDQEVDRMASIIKQFSKITEYTTKSYVGNAKIIDLEKSLSGDDTT